mmetsp:Transcript_160572/g.515432  ORF Transcript_160572/g.515432 Transcript_160572/m.515432 type:complete len:310 (-) Transcript_160572:148-1077(-)
MGLLLHGHLLTRAALLCGRNALHRVGNLALQLRKLRLQVVVLARRRARRGAGVPIVAAAGAAGGRAGRGRGADVEAGEGHDLLLLRLGENVSRSFECLCKRIDLVLRGLAESCLELWQLQNAEHPGALDGRPRPLQPREAPQGLRHDAQGRQRGRSGAGARRLRGPGLGRRLCRRTGWGAVAVACAKLKDAAARAGHLQLHAGCARRRDCHHLVLILALELLHEGVEDLLRLGGTCAGVLVREELGEGSVERLLKHDQDLEAVVDDVGPVHGILVHQIGKQVQLQDLGRELPCGLHGVATADGQREQNS